ncbi:phage tail tape measure protein, partial [Clostridioides difficile]
MQDVGKKMAMSITAPVLAVGAAASKLGMDFEASMSNVQGLSGATADEMVQLEKAAREAGASTSKTAKDAADALGYMALAGWDAKTSMEALM